MKFLTEEWFAEFQPSVLAAFAPGKTPTNVTLTLCELYSNVPQIGGNGMWLFYRFENGVVTECTRGLDKSTAPDADYVTDAEYDIVVKLLTGEMANAKAVLKGLVKIKGNATKALKLLSVHDVIDDCKRPGGKTEW